MARPNLGRTYAGLTDDPQQRAREHGMPRDWQQRVFTTEKEARAWEKDKLAHGCVGGPGGAGWRWGYTYTITTETKE
ncbi:MAG TPA: hypothetical protein VF992_08280 [Thermoplasmata archaeon]